MFFLGNGLVTSSGNIWQSHRQLISPGFQFESLKIMVSVFNSKTKNLIEKWKSLLLKDKKLTVELNKDLSYLTMSVITATACGYNFEDHPDGSTLYESIDIILEEMSVRIAETSQYWYLLFPFRYWKVQKSLQRFNSLFEKIVDDRIEKYNEFQDSNATSSAKSLNSYLQTDLLDLLLTSNSDNILSKVDIRDHIVTFLAAGHETTASTLLWIIYELCLNPHIQLKCQEEIDTLMVGKGEVGYEEINKFVYLNQVIQETMRLHPPVAVISRNCLNECMIGGYRLPPHTELVVGSFE